jgi:uncharacterized protein
MSGPRSPSLPPRLVPEEPFPPYSYVTGRFPHPTSDPQGHSFAHVPPAVPPIQPDRFQDSRAYLFACDLFNYGYYWEAHELWEALWKSCGRMGPTAEMLKGLIKLAAAGVKAREGRTVGVRRHAKRAAELFGIVRRETQASSYLGLDLNWLISIAEDLEQSPVIVAASRAAVEVVFPFRLLPDADSSAPERQGPTTE